MGHKLTEEEARQILENVVGYFKILSKWDQNARKVEEAQQSMETDEDPAQEPK